MKIRVHKNFIKKYKRLRRTDKKKFKERRNIFIVKPFEPTLNNHALRGKYKGYRSINISGDLRAIYKIDRSGVVIFVDVDKHSNLYS